MDTYNAIAGTSQCSDSLHQLHTSQFQVPSPRRCISSALWINTSNRSQSKVDAQRRRLDSSTETNYHKANERYWNTLLVCDTTPFLGTIYKLTNSSYIIQILGWNRDYISGYTLFCLLCLVRSEVDVEFNRRIEFQQRLTHDVKLLNLNLNIFLTAEIVE